jgi:hypothetical protein
MDHPPDSYRDFADIANARLATPPFFFYEKVGGEIVVLSCNYLLEQLVAKKSSRTEAVREFHVLLGILLMLKNDELELEIFHVGLGRISIRPYETHAVIQSKFF